MVILSLLLGLMTLPAIVVYHVFVRGKRSPADNSNRINHLRLGVVCLDP